MRLLASMKSKLLSAPARMLTPLLIATLTACATPAPPPPAPINPARINTPAAKPLSCTEFPPLTYSVGQPGATWADALAAANAHPDNPMGWVRSILGDTLTTRREIDGYVASRHALGCE